MANPTPLQAAVALTTLLVVSSHCLFSSDKTTVRIEGSGDWDDVYECLRDPAVWECKSMTITRTGNEMPRPNLFSYQTLGDRFLGATIPRTHIEELYLKDINLEYIPANFFRSLTSLKLLSLDNVGLEQVSSESFAGLTDLVTLELLGSRLTSLPTVDGEYRHMTSLSHIDFTGTLLSSGCIPNGITTTPLEILPSCSIYDQRLAFRPDYPVLMEHPPSPDFLRRFICAHDLQFMSQSVRHIYQIGIGNEVKHHYALVFVFDNGLMMSELTIRDSGSWFFRGSKINHIKSTCIKLDFHDELSRDGHSQTALALRMVTVHSPICRYSFEEDPYATSKKYPAVVLKQAAVPESTSFTGGKVLQMAQAYITNHKYYFPNNINSCITYAHVLYRDIVDLLNLSNNIPCRSAILENRRRIIR